MMTTHSVTHIGVGIDTARYGHRVTFLRDDRQPAASAITVSENQQGFEELNRQLQQLKRMHPDAHFHVHLDAAGQYAANLERFLRGLPLPITLSIGEPKRNKDYHKAFSPKRTTDDTESRAMARFAVVERPQQAPHVPDEILALREIASRLQGQVRDTTRTVNRLHNVLSRVFPELVMLAGGLAAGWVVTLLKKYPAPSRIAAAHLRSLEKIPYLKPQLAKELQAAAARTIASFGGETAEALVGECVRQLEHARKSEERLERLLLDAYRALPDAPHRHLASIPGMGPLTAAVLTAKMISIERFATPENLVGYFGVFPEENTSGVDRCGKNLPPGTMHMSAKGCDLVRRYLWNAAKSASRHNPAVRDLYARLRAKGTRGDVAFGHCMRKLLRQVFAVWASDTPFDEQRAQSRRTTRCTSQAPDVSAAGNKTAAGHKRDVLPETKVVTAATPSVAPCWASVNRAAAAPAGSVDFAYLREQVTIEQVLSHLGHGDRLRGGGEERRGVCPLHDSQGKRKADFRVNVRKNVFRCVYPPCGESGNVLDFWAAIHRLPLYDAALHLAETFHLQINRNREEEPVRKRQHKPK